MDSLGRDHQGTLTKMGLSFIVNTVTNSNDLDENEALLNVRISIDVKRMMM